MILLDEQLASSARESESTECHKERCFLIGERFSRHDWLPGFERRAGLLKG
jgi:hypothetical protein